MPLTRQYLRYAPSGSFNIIASPGCNGAWVTLKGQQGRFVAVGACEDIIVWDLNIGEKALVLPGEKTEVTALCPSPVAKYLAAGFKDGSVKTFDVNSSENTAVFTGHKSSVTCLAFDSEGHRLASGSKDTHIVIWDMVSESGIARLTSHTGPITALVFRSDNILISASKDTSIKFWDLDTNHCFKTLLGHRTEVWGIVLMRQNEYLVTGCGDSELRVWRLQKKEVTVDDSGVEDGVNLDADKEEEEDSLSSIQCCKAGSILRTDTGRVSTVVCDATCNILAVHGTSATLELFLFSSHLEALRCLKKRLKKMAKKASSDAGAQNPAENVPALQDVVKRLPVIKVKGKIKSSHLVLGKGGELRVLLTLNNNTVELYTVETADKSSTATCIRRITQQGHHSEVRALSFTSDGLAMVSGSGDSLKFWNRPSLSCVRTVPTGYVLSLAVVPGDRHVVAGMKDGKLLVVDISAGDVLEEIAAHEKEVWAVCILPNQRGCVSGAADGNVKFWDFDLIADEESKTSAKVLSLLHRRTLTVEEAVLSIAVTPNSKLIAVALLDMTVKIFFMDTLKFFLSLYGHKLPVTCMDISSDSTLIVTGGGDRNLKIWGLDFGDCHRSLFAHEDSITAIRFLPNTHYVFTCGRDGALKQWDVDHFNKITNVQSHFGEAWTLAVSENGQHVVTAGSDRVLRMSSKTDEPLVLEDEEEEERARLEREELVTGAESVVRGKGELNLPSRKTVGSEKGAEQIMECLEACAEYSAVLEENFTKKPDLPPIMSAYGVSTPEDFLLETLSRIRASDLEESLLLLPFPTVCQLLSKVPALLSRDHKLELTIKTLMFLVRIHHGPIVSNQTLLPIMQTITDLAFNKVHRLRDLIGCNLHGLQFLQRDVEDKEGVQLFRDASFDRKERIKRKKRKERAARRAVLSL